MKHVLIVLLCSIMMYAQNEYTEKIDKNSTVIFAQSTADGSTEMHTELLEQCIESLPSIASLEASVTSTTEYIRAINGEAGNDNHVKMYSAEITINYIEAQKMLLILTQQSIQAQEPKTEVHEKRLRKVMKFVSDSNNGKTFGNQSRRKYFFITADEAIADVKKQAAAWITQQQAILCNGTSSKTR